MLKYSDSARIRIQDGLRKYSRIVAQARQRGMNSVDTGDIVKAMLGDMLGYDPFFDVTSESSIRGVHADHAVLIEGRIQFLLLVKAIGTSPNAAHLLRLSGANVPSYVEWAVATNADTWACYRLGVGTDRHPEQVFRVSLMDASSLEERLESFAMLSKEGLKQNALGVHWEQSRALNASRIASIVLSDEVLNLLRRELNRTTNYRADKQVLRDLLVREVLRPETLTPLQPVPSSAQLPGCFAYVSDPNDPSSWRLYYRNPDGTPDPECLVIAASELSNNARSLNIPADDVPFVKQRLRQAYLELGVVPQDLPHDLQW